MRLGRLRPQCQRLVSYVLDGASVRSFGHRPLSLGRSPRRAQSAAEGNSHRSALGTDMEASRSRRFSVNCSRLSPLSAWRNLEDGFVLQSNGWTGSSPYSSAKKSAGAEDIKGPVAVDYSSLLEEEQFHKLADDVLHHLQDKLEIYGEDLNVEGFDLDHSSGVLTLRLGDLGIYVINKQTPNRQIWLSSPVSGPGRFDWSESKSSWIYRRNNIELVPLLEKELTELLGTAIHLS